ncbi:MAG: tripartite tricarboxylate transporter substrate binding protein, partial [Betaproteobacteria bacterium]
ARQAHHDHARRQGRRHAPRRDRGPRQGGNHVRRHARRRHQPARGIRRQRRRPRPFPHDGPRGAHDARGSGRPDHPRREGSPAAAAETARRIQAGGVIFSPPFKGGVARSAGVVTLVATGLFLSLSALAQYPSKPIRLVVTFPPGGITDFTARALGPRLSETLGQLVIIENKTGSGGNIGTDFVAKSAPDGHTLLIAAPPNAINVSLYRSLPFDTKKDLAPVALVGSGANVLVVSAKTPVASVRELLEHARRNPGKLNFASNGNGTSIHLSGELLKYYGKFDAVHVPFRGAPAAMAALLAGDVDFMFDALSISAPQIKAGKIRLLAVTSRERSPMFPDAPTLVESGFPEFDVSGWTGVMTTGGTPAAVIARLEAELRRILSDRELIAAFERPGMTVSFAGAREFGEFLDAEIRRWALAVKHSGAQAD